jgi:hypothetical protein
MIADREDLFRGVDDSAFPFPSGRRWPAAPDEAAGLAVDTLPIPPRLLEEEAMGYMRMRYL